MHPTISRLKEAIKVREPLKAEPQILRAFLSQVGGGSITAHDVALAEFLLLSPVISHHVVQGIDGNAGAALLQTAEGGVAVLESAAVEHEKDSRIDIEALAHGGLLKVLVCDGGQVTTVERWEEAGIRTMELPSPAGDRGDWISSGLQEFAQVLNGHPTTEKLLVPLSKWKYFSKLLLSSSRNGLGDAEGEVRQFVLDERLIAIEETRNSPYPKAESLSSDGDKIGFAIFGTGRMGRLRASAINKSPMGKVEWGSDVIPACLEIFSAEFPTAKTAKFPDAADEILSDEKVKAVLVATTSASHCDVILRSLQKNKHVFCEKPLALSSADTQRCVEEAISRRLGLYCGFHRRSDRLFRELQQNLQVQQKAGRRLQSVRITSREPQSQNTVEYMRTSGGFLYDSLIHDFDMALWLVAPPARVVEIFCRGHAYLPVSQQVNDVDSISVLLKFNNGVICIVDNHRSTPYGYDQRLEVRLDNGESLRVLNPASQQELLDRAEAREQVRNNPPPGMERYAQAYSDEIQHFVSLLSGEDKVARSLNTDCLRGALIADAAAASLRTGKVQRVLI